MNDGSLSLMLLEYLNICRSEQRILENAIRRSTIHENRAYNLLDRYMSLIVTENRLYSTPIFRRATMLTRTSNSYGGSSASIPRPPSTPPPPLPDPPSSFAALAESVLNRHPARLTEANICATTGRFLFSDLSSNYLICPITRDYFQPSDLILKITHCGHIFKENALREWFRRNTSCPVCRHNLQTNHLTRLNRFPT